MATLKFKTLYHRGILNNFISKSFSDNESNDSENFFITTLYSIIEELSDNIERFFEQNVSVFGKKSILHNFEDINSFHFSIHNIPNTKILEAVKLLEEFVKSGAIYGRYYTSQFISSDLSRDDYKISVNLKFEDDEIRYINEILNVDLKL